MWTISFRCGILKAYSISNRYRRERSKSLRLKGRSYFNRWARCSPTRIALATTITPVAAFENQDTFPRGANWRASVPPPAPFPMIITRICRAMYASSQPWAALHEAAVSENRCGIVAILRPSRVQVSIDLCLISSPPQPTRSWRPIAASHKSASCAKYSARAWRQSRLRALAGATCNCP